MVVYECASDYLSTAKSVEEKIVKIDVLIDGLFDAMTKAIASGEIQEYHIDDGQSRIRTIYRSVPDLMKGMHQYETMRALYANKLCGRVTVLKDFNSNR